VKKVSKLFFK